ncbi:TPM domain-containing protein [Ignavibacterium sp.]|uniref:TPM domain-containing protein n=1 Tax=Ignavibacterium sp. TaxID=2651167 RepID=UPI00307F8B45
MSKRIIYNFLSDDELLRISNKIKETEKKTSAEIVVAIQEERKFLQKRKSLRQLAEIEFNKAGIANTADKKGVLIFILLSDKQFYILADKKVSDKINQNTFDQLANKMSEQFKSGNFASGILNCVDSLGKLLSLEFPVKSDDVDELSNKVIVS